MRALIQRVSRASVTIDGNIVGQIGPGVLALVCAMRGDGEAEAEKLAAKLSKLRIFEDEAGKMNRSLVDTGGAALRPDLRLLLAACEFFMRPREISGCERADDGQFSGQHQSRGQQARHLPHTQVLSSRNRGGRLARLSLALATFVATL